MDSLFTFFKVLVMAVLGLSIPLWNKTISTEDWDIPVWIIPACLIPVTLLYIFLG